MSSKLPCCDFNKKSEDKNLKCDDCECFFRNEEELDDHTREMHKSGITGKRKMKCCEYNANRKRVKYELHHHSCEFCECTFQKKKEKENHINGNHKCRKCYQIVLTEEIRAEHEIKHVEEQRQKDEKEKKQREMDADLVRNYVKTGKLDEYQIDPNYELNVYDILVHHYMEKDELLQFAKKFEIDNIIGYGDMETFSCEDITYLLENNAVEFKDVTVFLDGTTYWLGDDEIVSELLAYFLDKGYDIKPEWVAKAINDDALMERIKQKYTFTFDEIYKARRRDSMFDQSSWDDLYVQVRKHFPKHFPNPNRSTNNQSKTSKQSHQY